MGGDATVVAAPAAENPYAQFGLNPDGTPIVAKAAAVPDPIAAENAALKATVAGLEGKLSKIATDFEGNNKKFAVVDRLVKALAGEGENPDSAKYKQAWSEIKEIARIAAPQVYKNLDRWERDPSYYDRLEGTANALAGARLSDLNTSAHGEVVGLAKQIWRNASVSDLNEIVLPFEQTMTAMINANETLQKRFASGDMTVVKEMFERLVKPHVASRLKEKAARLGANIGPKAPPRSGGSVADAASEVSKKLDLSTPAKKAAFHKAAVGRFMDRPGKDDA
jgi:hypothetical protein